MVLTIPFVGLLPAVSLQLERSRAFPTNVFSDFLLYRFCIGYLRRDVGIPPYKRNFLIFACYHYCGNIVTNGAPGAALPTAVSFTALQLERSRAFPTKHNPNHRTDLNRKASQFSILNSQFSILIVIIPLNY